MGAGPTRLSLVTMPVYSTDNPSLALASLYGYLAARGIEVFRHEFQAMVDTRSITSLLDAVYTDGDYLRRVIHQRESLSQEGQQLAAMDAIAASCARAILLDRPQIVGFSVVSTNALLSLAAAEHLRALDPEVRIVFGGPDCDLRKNAWFFMRTGRVDAVVVGEGEETLWQLAERFSRDDAGPCRGALVREGDAILDGGERADPVDMDALPFPDYAEYAPLAAQQRLVQLAVAFNRGCIGKCAYCFESRYWRTFRQMSPRRAVETLAHLASTCHVSSFALNQCLLNADLEWMREFCDLLIQRKIGVRWKGNARVHPGMDAVLLGHMHEAGCRALLFGLESGSQAVLNQMRKGTRVSHARRVIKAARACGIWVHAYWIFGFPGETRDDLIRTLDFIVGEWENIDSHTVHLFELYPGAPLDHDGEDPDRRSRGEYRHWRRDPTFKSAAYLEHAGLIDALVGILNGRCVSVPADLAIVDEVRHLPLKKQYDLEVLLTILLLRRALRDDATMDRLQRSATMPSRLVQTYGPILEALGANRDDWPSEVEVVDRVLAAFAGEGS